MEGHPELHIAYHEAGHAVIAVHYGFPLRHVTIIPDDEHLGHVSTESPKRQIDAYNPNSDPMRIERVLRRYYQFCMAGAEAVMLVCPEHTYSGIGADLPDANSCLRHLSADDDERDAWQRLLDIQTRNLVARYRPAIEALAAALMERKALTGKEVRAIVRACARTYSDTKGVQ
jgi:ATP-dependent Zn protease